MSFPQRPDYSKSQIDRAGSIASSAKIGSKEYSDAIHIVDQWRKAHGYPIHTFFVTLQRKARQVSHQALIARRLKRMPTILDKLGNRQDAMRLSRMQDIGGVRAILPDVQDVYSLFTQYSNNKRFPHILKGDPHDYIAIPKESGYRGIHLVYEFNNVQGRSSQSRLYDGLKVEVQLRSQLQHEWATAVEAVGMLLGEELKSSKGSKIWLSFFQAISSVIAAIEGQPVLAIHRHLRFQELVALTKKLALELNAIDKIKGWLTGVRLIEDRIEGYYYHILSLNIEDKTVRIIGFKESEFEQANTRLIELEKLASEKKAPEPVLVAAGDLKKLSRAYPNYFLDMSDFLEIVQEVCHTSNSDV